MKTKLSKEATKFKMGEKVKAVVRITEGGVGPGNLYAVFPDKQYVHAEPGDEGEVVDIQGGATVRFKSTGTATIVADTEITLL